MFQPIRGPFLQAVRLCSRKSGDKLQNDEPTCRFKSPLDQPIKFGLYKTRCVIRRKILLKRRMKERVFVVNRVNPIDKPAARRNPPNIAPRLSASSLNRNR